MNTLKLEVVRFDAEDVIATSFFNGRYFTTKSEWLQFDTENDEGVSDNYIGIEGRGFGDDPDAFWVYDEGVGPFATKYAWYDTATSQWHTNNKYSDDYWDGSSFNFPTGTN